MNFFKLLGQELLQLIENVAREKGISREKMLEAVESAVAEAVKEKYGREYDITAEISKNGEFFIAKKLTVVESVEDPMREISTEDAAVSHPEAVIGDVVSEDLPVFDFGRTAANTARKALAFKIKEAEKLKQYEEFKDRLGDVVSGAVKRSEYNNIIVDIGGRAEAILRREYMIPTENYRIGDKVTAYIYDVKYDVKGYQVFLSRTHNEFLSKLFEQEVPEIYDKVIRIMDVARDCGSHAKISVYCKDPNIDPVGTCVGIRGSRVQPIVHELHGEKVDIIIWSDNPATYVANALSPATVQRVTIDKTKNLFEVVVPDDQLSIAIGRRGQNIKLASKLTSCQIDVTSESADGEKRTKEFHSVSSILMEALDCDEVIASLLAVEGYVSAEQVANTPVSELEKIEGFDESIAQELQNRAKDYLAERESIMNKRLDEIGVDAKMRALPVLSGEMLYCLAENNIKTVEQLRELSSDELLDILGVLGLKHSGANEVIMKSREGWI